MDSTTSNDRKLNVLQKISESIAELCSYGFSKPQVIESEFMTTLTLKLADIAIEVEIDWRDFDIYLLVVKLENGELPSGYYVSNGHPCRYHLQMLVSNRKWSFDKEAYAIISSSKKNKSNPKDRNEDYLLNRYFAYKRVLESCLNNLLKEKENIF